MINESVIRTDIESEIFVDTVGRHHSDVVHTRQIEFKFRSTSRADTLVFVTVDLKVHVIVIDQQTDLFVGTDFARVAVKYSLRFVLIYRSHDRCKRFHFANRERADDAIIIAHDELIVTVLCAFEINEFATA